MPLHRIALGSAPALFASLGVAVLSWPLADVSVAARVAGAAGAASAASAASRPMSDPAPMPLPSPMPPASMPDPTARVASMPMLPRASGPIVAPLHLRSASMTGRECQARRNAHPEVTGPLSPAGTGTPMPDDGPCGIAPPAPSLGR